MLPHVKLDFFKRQLRDLLLIRRGGIHFRSLQYDLENHSNEKFPLEEFQYLKFADFIHECDFLEVRSATRATGFQEIFVFIKESEIDEEYIHIRERLPIDEKDTLRSQTTLKPIEDVFACLPRFFRPKVAYREPQPKMVPVTASTPNSQNYGAPQSAEVGSNKTNNTIILNNGDEFIKDSSSSTIRIKRTSLYDHRSPTKDSTSKDKSSKSPNSMEKVDSKPIPTGQSNSQLSMDDPMSVRLPFGRLPKEKFYSKLLGCDGKSIFYIHQVDKTNNDKYGTLDKGLRELKREALRPIPSEYLEEGFMVLCYNNEDQYYFRAQIDSVDPDDLYVIVSAVDSGCQFEIPKKLTYFLPDRLPKHPPRAIKICLRYHEEYLNTDLVTKAVAENVNKLPEYINCRFVFFNKDVHLPVCEFYTSEGEKLDFRHLIDNQIN